MMATITHREIVLALRELGLNRDSDVIAHVSLSAFGHVRGGAESMLGALLAVCGTVIMPTFTYQTMVWPEVGPPNNACVYGNHAEENARAVMFTLDLPADRSMGQVAEVLRRRPGTLRSAHPVLSFAAAGAHAQGNPQCSIAGKSVGAARVAARSRRRCAAPGRGSSRQHGDSPGRKTGRAQAVHPVGRWRGSRLSAARLSRLQQRL